MMYRVFIAIGVPKRDSCLRYLIALVWQGLKPFVFYWLCGTTEVVPCYKTTTNLFEINFQHVVKSALYTKALYCPAAQRMELWTRVV